MTNESILITVLAAACALLLLSHLLFLVRHIVKRTKKRRVERSAEKQALADARKASGELPTEILLVLLTAAANSALGGSKKTAFRVVSFHRAEKKKERFR